MGDIVKEEPYRYFHLTPFMQQTHKFYESPEYCNDIYNESLIPLEFVEPTTSCSLKIQSLTPQPFLKKRIQRHVDAFTASGKLVQSITTLKKSIFSVGMVCFDGGKESTAKSISVCDLEGQTVHLDVQKLTQYSFFPAQVIGIEGTNPDGCGLIASSVIDDLPLPVSSESDVDGCPAKKLALDQSVHHSSSNIEYLHLVIAAGPFTTIDNLLFQPLMYLLEYASRMRCELLILGNTDFEDIFNVTFMKELKRYAKYTPHARVVLVPSIRDLNNKPVFPQAAFADSGPEHFKEKITYLANPELFEANKVTIGCCNVDILKELDRLQISKGFEDRMGCSLRHVLHQHSFYPLYPPPEDVPLNYSVLETPQFSSIPDILILPSDLDPFIKKQSVGDGTHGNKKVCISVNPGRLADCSLGGTFIELLYHEDLCRARGLIIHL